MMEGLDHFLDLIGGGAVRRHQNENISDRTSEQSKLACPLTNCGPDSFFGWKRGSGGAIGDEFNGENRTLLANIADMWMGPEGGGVGG